MSGIWHKSVKLNNVNMWDRFDKFHRHKIKHYILQTPELETSLGKSSIFYRYIKWIQVTYNWGCSWKIKIVLLHASQVKVMFFVDIWSITKFHLINFAFITYSCVIYRKFGIIVAELNTGLFDEILKITLVNLALDKMYE